jgi:hypothetical protein
VKVGLTGERYELLSRQRSLDPHNRAHQNRTSTTSVASGKDTRRGSAVITVLGDVQQSDCEDDPAWEQDDDDEQSLRQAGPIVQGSVIWHYQHAHDDEPARAAAPAAKV